MKSKKQQVPQPLQDKKIQMSLVKIKYYNMMDNISKPLSLLNAELGKTYIIIGPFYKNKLYFRCIKSGKILIKYKKGMGHDILLLKGSGILRLNEKKMEETNV